MYGEREVFERKQDIAEHHRDHQSSAYHEYIRHTKLYPEWKRVKCEKRGVLETKEAIHRKILKLIAGELRV